MTCTLIGMYFRTAVINITCFVLAPVITTIISFCLLSDSVGNFLHHWSGSIIWCKSFYCKTSVTCTHDIYMILLRSKDRDIYAYLLRQFNQLMVCMHVYTYHYFKKSMVIHCTKWLLEVHEYFHLPLSNYAWINV